MFLLKYFHTKSIDPLHRFERLIVPGNVLVPGKIDTFGVKIL